MGRHPMGEGTDPNPRIVAEKLVVPSALVMGKTAENLHDRYPAITKERCDAFAVASQNKLAKAYAEGKIQQDLVPVATRNVEKGWGLATADEPPRPGTTVEELAKLKTPFRAHGNVTAGNAAGLNDGATACILASEESAKELGLPVGMRLVDFAFVGVDPEVMGIGPVPATEKALAKAECGGLIGVGRGSARPPRLVTLTYKPAKATKHISIVGKGITFDSGGLCIKPANGMATMKCDMAGAAAVAAFLEAVAALELPVAVTGYLCLAENLSLIHI